MLGNTCRLDMLDGALHFGLQKLQKLVVLAFVEIQNECLILHIVGIEDLATEIYREGIF